MTITKKENPLVTKSFEFALEIVRTSQSLQLKKEYILSKQLLRSGTSIGAMVTEAQQAESRADFIHKLSIANKEAHETRYWLRLLKASGIINNEAEKLIGSCEDLIKLLVKIINTSKSRG